MNSPVSYGLQLRTSSRVKFFAIFYCLFSFIALGQSGGKLNEKDKALYERQHGADALSTCLQWQQDNKGSHVDGLTLVFQPECGVLTRGDREGPLSLKKMPPEGAGFASARSIVDAAVAQRPFPTEPFDNCDQWQLLALQALVQSNYPAYPNVTEQYVSPRCGIRLSNNETREHVYVWLPESLTPVSSEVENQKHRCMIQDRRDGNPAFQALPCIIQQKDAFNGMSFAPISSIPEGASISLNGAVIAQTPALVVFQQPGIPGTTITIHVAKQGFKEGDVSINTSQGARIQLTRSP